jgi:hypothetical protein
VLGVAAAVAVVVALLIGGLLPFAHLGPSGSSPSSVDIRDVNLSLTPQGNPCFGSGYGTSTPSTVAAGGTFTLQVPLRDQDPAAARSCTVGQVLVDTPGFTLQGANVPFLVPDTGSATLTIVVNVPDSSYSGSLNLSAAVTYLAADVQVLAQNVTFSPSSNPCGVSTFGTSGFSVFSNASYNDSIGLISISPQQYCDVSGVSVSTPGFTVQSAGTPVALPIDSTASVSFVLGTPATSFEGDLGLTLTLSWS